MNIENRHDESGCHIFFPEITYDSWLYAIAFRQILPLNAHPRLIPDEIKESLNQLFLTQKADKTLEGKC